MRSCLLVIACGLAALPARAVPALELARPFGTQMVLPMNRPVPVWGSARPGATVTVQFAGQRRQVVAGPDGAWRVVLAPLAAAGDGRALLVEAGSGETLRLEDLLVGEVWLCSGQSNMDFPLASATGGREEARQADRFPALRLCNLQGVATANRPFTPAERTRVAADRYFEGTWQVAGEASALPFSAVAWWAGTTIHAARQVPVGLVENAVGGSGAEAWLPREALAARPDCVELLGPGWLDSARIGGWARGRAKVNLGAAAEGDHPYRPGFLFDAGVRWWRDFPFDGVLWYQGETNAEIRDDLWNERLITDLVGGWRRVLGQPRLPFLMVQLPRIGGNDPLRRHWPEFRAVQARAAAKLARVQLVPTTDLGWDSPDVHPPDKRPLGVRLGQRAAARAGQAE